MKVVKACEKLVKVFLLLIKLKNNCHSGFPGS